jgi:hypothetical protein
MGYIIIDGWEVGLNKVGLTLLQQKILKKRLFDSKRNVDNLLNGEIVVIEENDSDTANLFVKEAVKIGAKCKYIP